MGRGGSRQLGAEVSARWSCSSLEIACYTALEYDVVQCQLRLPCSSQADQYHDAASSSAGSARLVHPLLHLLLQLLADDSCVLNGAIGNGAR